MIERLDEIRKRMVAATPGPWEAPLKDLGGVESFQAVDFYFDHSFEAYPPLGFSGPLFVASDKENADFIAHSREDIQYLVEHIAPLLEKLTKAERFIKIVEEYINTGD